MGGQGGAADLDFFVEKPDYIKISERRINIWDL